MFVITLYLNGHGIKPKQLFQKIESEGEKLFLFFRSYSQNSKDLTSNIEIKHIGIIIIVCKLLKIKNLGIIQALSPDSIVYNIF